MADFEENKITIDNPENQGDDEYYASLEEYFIDCCRHGELDEVKQAILDGVDVNYFDNNLNTPLHMACANGHIDIIKELLQVKKDDKRVVNVNARNADGSTPLHWAVINDQKVALELLIENGADCNIKSKYEHTPLDEAILGGRYEIAEILASKTKPGEEELIVVEEEDDKVENGVGGDDDEGEEEADDS